MRDEDKAGGRLFGEGTKAYAAFTIFRDLGATRSVSKAAQACTKSASLLKRWSSRWRWVDRASEWDKIQQEERAANERERRDALDRASLDVAERHVRMGTGISVSSYNRLMRLIEAGNLKPAGLIRLLALGVDMERRALGLDKFAIELTGKAGKSVEVNDGTEDIEGKLAARLAAFVESARMAKEAVEVASET